jgi:predicted ATPase
MGTLFPGCGLAVQQVPNTNAVTLGLRTSDEMDFVRPVHAGFGLTQILPIVVAALSATSGDILLIENPEVHLHPAGQASIGQFLADVAAAGVQVIVETHSDHVLNGIRRAVKLEKIRPEQVGIHFFQQRLNGGEQVHSLILHSSGALDAWPSGFFDQFDKDMNFFAGWE